MFDKKKMLLGVAALVVLVIIYYLITKPNEEFTSNDQEITVPSAIYDRETGQIMSGGTAQVPFLGVPDEVQPAWGAKFGEVDKLDDGGNGMFGLNYSMCSKSCCSPQYPPPFELDTDVVASKGDFVPNSYKCNNAWQDSGCVCMTGKERDFLASRGGNCGAKNE